MTIDQYTLEQLLTEKKKKTERELQKFSKLKK